MKKKIFYTLGTFFFLVIIGNEVFSQEYRYLRRSPRGILMGDAYTAIADDEYTLFYNPAALARHKGVSLYLANPEVSATNVLEEMDRFENFPQRDAAAIADRILGFPFHFGVGGMPSVKMNQLGMSMYANANLDMELRNATHPALDIDYRYDRGFVIGYGFKLGTGKSAKRNKKKKTKGTKQAGQYIAGGVSVKSVNRQGLSKSFDLFGLELLNTIAEGNSDNVTELRKSLGYTYGKGYGWDVGVESALISNYSELRMGFAVLDVFDTTFTRVEGTGKIPKQDMTMSFGTAFNQDFYIIDYTLSFDIHPINSAIDFKRKLHVGFEVDLPIIRLMAGWNGGYVSYGAGIDFWPITLYAGFYGIELGKEYQQEEGKRAIVYLSLFDFSLDG